MTGGQGDGHTHTFALNYPSFVHEECIMGIYVKWVIM